MRLVIGGLPSFSPIYRSVEKRSQTAKKEKRGEGIKRREIMRERGP